MIVNEPAPSAHYVLKSQLRPVWWRRLFRWLWLWDFRAPRPDLVIDIGRDTLRVTDASSNALIASASLAQVTAKPANHNRFRADDPDVVYPVLVLNVPGMQPLTIGSLAIGYRDFVDGWNSRFSWRGNVPSENGSGYPPYALLGEDWLTLVDKFGLARRLKEKDNARR